MIENGTHDDQAKPSSRKRRLIIRGVISSIIIGLCVGLYSVWAGTLRISPETTYLTEPLTADGRRVDYFHAIELETYPPKMKTDDNGYRLLVRALGSGIDPAEEDAENLTSQAYEKLGLDPAVKPTMTYQGSCDFLEKHQEELRRKREENAPAREEVEQEEEDLSRKKMRPWNFETLPMMADWLKANGPALDLLIKAVQQPEFCAPMVRTDDTEPLLDCRHEHLYQLRELARGLSTRANFRIGTGDLDGAIDDILACQTLGHRIRQQEPSLIGQFVGISMVDIASGVGIASMLEHDPTETQLQRLLDVMLADIDQNQNKAVPEKRHEDPFKRVLRHERFTMLDNIQSMAVFGIGPNGDFRGAAPEGFIAKLQQKAAAAKINWNKLTKRINYYYDNPEAWQRLQKEKKAQDKTFWSTTRDILVEGFSGIIAETFLSLTFPPMEAMQKAFHRAECVKRVQIITLAMLIYEKQHGRLPPAYTVDEQGRPLHSWQTLLLPHLGTQAKKLHAKLRLDEPWDSPHNKKFHTAAIPFYQCPGVQLALGETTYSVVIGEKTAFSPGEGKTLDQLGPQSADMILVLGNQKPHCWMNPTSDLTEANVMTIFDGDAVHPGLIVMGLRSGSVISVDREIDRDVFQQGLEGTKSNWQK